MSKLWSCSPTSAPSRSRTPGLLLTVRAREKELLEVSDLRDRLFIVLAHDLRGPIGNLQSLLQMIGERLGEPEMVKYLVGLGTRSAHQTYNLTENLLNTDPQPDPGQRVAVAKAYGVRRTDGRGPGMDPIRRTHTVNGSSSTRGAGA